MKYYTLLLIITSLILFLSFKKNFDEKSDIIGTWRLKYSIANGDTSFLENSLKTSMKYCGNYFDKSDTSEESRKEFDDDIIKMYNSLNDQRLEFTDKFLFIYQLKSNIQIDKKRIIYTIVNKKIKIGYTEDDELIEVLTYNKEKDILFNHDGVDYYSNAIVHKTYYRIKK